MSSFPVSFPVTRRVAYAPGRALLGGASIPSGVLRGSDSQTAKFQRDAANGRYWFNAVSYASESAFLTAAGGAAVSAARVFGPYTDPTNTNWLVNGDFASGTSPWAAFGTGASIANVSGELETTSGGSLNAYTQGVSGTLGKAYNLTGTGRRGTSPNSFSIGSAATAALGGNLGGAFTSTSNATLSVLASSVADTTYFGVRNSSGSGSGTAYFDNVTLVQVRPLSNWTVNNVVGLVEATTPATSSVDQVAFQADAGTERDRVRLVRLFADNTLHLIITCNNAVQADLNLGVVAASTFFSVAFALAQNSFTATLNGGVPVSDTVGVLPGAAVMRIGRSFTGDAWTGTDPFVAVF